MTDKDLTVPELREKLEEAGQPTEGRKEELEERLQKAEGKGRGVRGDEPEVLYRSE